MAAMLTGLALVAFSSVSVAQTARTVKKSEKTSVTKPAPEKSKSVTRSAPASKKAVKPSATRPSTTRPSATRPDKPQTQKPAAKPNRPSGPQKPATKLNRPSGPQKPATRPNDRPGHDMKPGHRPDGPKRPSGKPDHFRPGRPGIIAPRPPRPKPRPIVAPVMIFRPPVGALISINISPSKLRLSKTRLHDDVDYFYEDGLFYVMTEYGTYYEIDPPAGALVERLPSDVRRFTIDGMELYRYEDTAYRLVAVAGVPYFEVLGQIL